ncbi:MAG: patatin-like phospholipase family protein [Bacteroidota bacterium]
MKTSVILFVMVIAGFGYPGLTSVQVKAQTTPPDTLNLSFSVSGGASLGSYQAGLNWAVLTFIKEGNANPDYLNTLFNEPFPHFRLSGYAGSSAGNINGLLTSIEWYKNSIRTAEESVLWKTWIDVGIEQLFPFGATKRGNDYRSGIFHRKYLEQHLARYLYEQTRSDIRQTDEILDLGVTLTRLDPISLEIDGSVIKTQRFVTTFSAYSIPMGGINQLTFHQNDAVIYAFEEQRPFGQLIQPNFSGDPYERFKEVLNISMASSAIPFFFEPIELQYRNLSSSDPDLLRTASFVDGGIFDNRPLDLALKMYGARYDAQPASNNAFRLLYLDVNHRRKVDSSLVVDESRTATNGTESVLRLMSGAYSTARHYELEVLYRNSDLNVFEQVEATDRKPDVVGDFWGGLGAFFGKPFRQYDFYTGIYDGLYYISDRFVEDFMGCQVNCDQQRATIIQTLYQKMELSPEARFIIKRHYADEFGVDALPFDMDQLLGNESYPFYKAIFGAFEAFNRELRAYNALSKQERIKEEQPNLPEFFYWFGKQEVEIPGGDSVTMKQHLSNTYLESTHTYATTYTLPTGLVDRSFKEAVVNFSEFEKQLMGRFFHQWWRIENDYFNKTSGFESWEYIPEMAQFLYFKGNPSKKLGWNPSPTIIQANHNQFYRYILPYHFSFNTVNTGLEVGYDWFIVPDILHLPIEPFVRNSRVSGALMARAGIGIELPISNTFQVGLTAGSQHKYENLSESLARMPVNHIGLHVDYQNLLRIGTELTDADLGPLFGQNRPILGVKIGIIDLNGLLYWAGRLIN